MLSIYTADEYYNKRAGEMKIPDDDIQGNMELADLAFILELYDKSFAQLQEGAGRRPGLSDRRSSRTG